MVGEVREEGRGGGSPSIFPFKPWLARQLRPSRGGRGGGGGGRGVASAAHRHQSQGGKSRRQEKGGCCFEAAPPFTSIFVPESSSDASQSCRRQAAALPQRARPTKAPPPEANLILSLSLPRKLQRKFVQNTVIGAPTTNPRPPNNCGISFL